MLVANRMVMAVGMPDRRPREHWIKRAAWHRRFVLGPTAPAVWFFHLACVLGWHPPGQRGRLGDHQRESGDRLLTVRAVTDGGMISLLILSLRDRTPAPSSPPDLLDLLGACT